MPAIVEASALMVLNASDIVRRANSTARNTTVRPAPEYSPKRKLRPMTVVEQTM
jgi:hypothetical protein